MLSRIALGVLTVAFVAFGGWLWALTGVDEPPSTGYDMIWQAQPVGLETEPSAALPVEQPPVPAAEGKPTPISPEGATSTPLSTSVDLGWLTRTAAATGIPERALAAYAMATLRVGVDEPGCGIGWNTVAAIGSVESGHGSHGGSAIGDDGVVRPGIFGPRLDGVQFAHIGDSDGGGLDGDDSIDRAVGPFQFIPQTWATWGSDGDGDGRADPQNMTDAALSAARYLCSYGNLTGSESWRGAVFGYNHDNDYVDLIATRASEYGRLAQ